MGYLTYLTIPCTITDADTMAMYQDAFKIVSDGLARYDGHIQIFESLVEGLPGLFTVTMSR